MRLSFLGRGSAFNVAEGNTSAYYKKEGIVLLFDCGSNVFERLMKTEILQDAKALYIAVTHLHPDHAGSLGDLIFYCYYILKIPVLLSCTHAVQDYLLLCGVTPDKYRFFSGEIPGIGRITPVPQPHVEIKLGLDGVCRESADPAYRLESGDRMLFRAQGFLLEAEGKRLFYSGDTSKVDFDKMGQIDEYYIECCYADFPGNPHYHIERLYQDCVRYNPEIIPFVCCMHFDSGKAIERARELGFRVAQVTEKDRT